MTVVAERSLSSPPYEGYAAITGVFVGGPLGVPGLAARVFGRNPGYKSALDFAVLSAALFNQARTRAGRGDELPARPERRAD